MTEVIEGNIITPDSTAKELNKAMSALDTPDVKSDSTVSKLITKIGKLNLVFLVIPILILIILSIKQPTFVTKEVEDPNDNTKNIRVLNYKMLLIVTLFISLIFPGVYYGYTFYYKK